jgi:hypothetical protein
LFKGTSNSDAAVAQKRTPWINTTCSLIACWYIDTVITEQVIKSNSRRTTLLKRIENELGVCSRKLGHYIDAETESLCGYHNSLPWDFGIMVVTHPVGRTLWCISDEVSRNREFPHPDRFSLFHRVSCFLSDRQSAPSELMSKTNRITAPSFKSGRNWHISSLMVKAPVKYKPRLRQEDVFDQGHEPSIFSRGYLLAVLYDLFVGLEHKFH